MEKLALRSLYSQLRRAFGFQDWWPGDTKLEIVVGAVLTQQTSWKNVEKAIGNIKEARAMKLETLAKMSLPRMEALVRPSGFYRQKARRLRSMLSAIYRGCGSLGRFFKSDAETLRERLLKMDGIGRETADSIILYAAEKPTFVIDAYTKRVLGRMYGLDEGIPYDELQGMIERSIKPDLELYKDFHAQFVELGKRRCRVEPLCSECPVRRRCGYFHNVYLQRG